MQWILYRRVCEVWNQGQILTEWTDARISLLYEKGDPGDASNYRPIAMSTCMYQITTKFSPVATVLCAAGPRPFPLTFSWADWPSPGTRATFVGSDPRELLARGDLATY